MQSLNSKPILFRFKSISFLGTILSLLILPALSGAMQLNDLDSSRRVDWSRSGYPGPISHFSENIINVLDNSASGQGCFIDTVLD